jgi:hypothetical protein
MEGALMAKSTKGEEMSAIVAGLDESRVREAIAAAVERQGGMSPFSGSRSEDVRALKLEALRRLSDKLTGGVGCAGIADEQLEKVRAQSRSELARIADGHKEHVIRQSSKERAQLLRETERWRRQVEELNRHKKGLSPNLNFNFVILDTPALILPTQDINLIQVSPSPWSNMAKITGNWSSPYPDNQWDSLSYVFAWENPSDSYALVNVESYLGLNGFCDAAAGPGYNHARLDIIASLSLFEWWNNPATYPPYQSTQTNYGPAFLAPDGGGPTGLGDYESAAVLGYFDVSYRLFMIPPKSVAVFTVNLGIYHSVSGEGYVDVDFASNHMEVLCPALVIAILS